MDGDVEQILRRIVRENQDARARFAGLASRTSSAVVTGKWEDFQEIIKEAGSDASSDDPGNDTAEDQAGSPSTMED